MMRDLRKRRLARVSSGLGRSPTRRTRGLLRAMSGSGVGRGGEQRPRVGMARVAQDHFGRPVFHGAAEIEHQHVVGNLAHDGEIVADEQQAGRGIRAAGRSAGSGSAPGSRRRAPTPPRRRRPASASGSSRARCRRAGSARRRVRADSG